MENKILSCEGCNALLPKPTAEKYEFVDHPHGQHFVVGLKRYDAETLTPFQAAKILSNGYKFIQLKQKSAKATSPKAKEEKK